jgi:hypothetical protein
MLGHDFICILLVCFLFFHALGCASGTVKCVSVDHQLPPDLSPELVNRYQVRDLADETHAQSVKQKKVRKKASKKGVKNWAKEEIEKEPKKEPKKVSDEKSISSSFGGTSVNSTTFPLSYPFRRPSQDPIWVGEKLIFGIYYFGVSAAHVNLEVLPFKRVGDRKAYHVQAHALTSPVFSIFYRLDDVIETFIDYEGIFSHQFHVVLDETKQKRDALELYDSQKKETFYWNRWHPKDGPYRETKETAPIEPFPQDSLSALYYLRTMPLTEGSVFSFPMVSEGKGWEAVCTVVRREMLSTALGRVPTVVIQPEMKYQGVLKKNGDSFLWLTDDERRIPVRLEAKVKVGTVVAHLKKIELGQSSKKEEGNPPRDDKSKEM